jgi:Fe2+ transport system protein FeoA
MQLSQLHPQDRFVVMAVLTGKEVGRRLADMGLTAGTEGKVVRRGVFGGPMQVRLHGYDLLLRREEAALIEVELVASGRQGRQRHRRRLRFGPDRD